MKLYPLDAKDVEAIAKSRANRTAPQNIKYWIYGGVGLVFAGFVHWGFANGGMVGLGVMAVGVIVAWYGTSLADKRRKSIIAQLKAEWRRLMVKP